MKTYTVEFSNNGTQILVHEGEKPEREFDKSALVTVQAERPVYAVAEACETVGSIIKLLESEHAPRGGE